METNRLKTRKRIAVICIVSVVTILVCSVGYAMQNDSIAKLFGKQQAQVLTDAGDGVVATLNGEKITKKGFDTYKLFAISGENNLSDKQILDKILDSQIVYQEAVKEGLTATDEEVDAAIKTAQNSVKIDAEQYKSFQDYISGLNMSEDQYWESVKPVYKKAVTCGNYKKSLKVKFKKENYIQDQKELDSKFKDFYNQKVKELKSKAEINSTIK